MRIANDLGLLLVMVWVMVEGLFEGDAECCLLWDGGF